MSLDTLPPRQRLELVLSALCRRLPSQLGGLLDVSRFTEARSALLRLADPRWASQAVASMDEAEAAWLAEQLWARWASVGQPAFEPVALLSLPQEVWVGAAPIRTPVELHVLGVDDGWSVRWSGPVIGANPAVLLIEPPRTGAPWRAAVQATVSARVGGRPIELTASGEIRLRRPAVVFGATRRSLVVRDQAGRPASRVRVQIGDVELITTEDGAIATRHPFPPRAPVRVEGFLIGRVPPPDDSLDEPTVEIKRSRSGK